MIVISQKPGQLGNNLNLFANFMGFAREHGVRIVNPSFYQYSEYFECSRSGLFAQYPSNDRSKTTNSRLSELLAMFLDRVVYYTSAVLKRLHLPLVYRFGGVIEAFDMYKPFILDAACPGKKRGIVFTRGYFFRDRENMRKHADEIRRYFTPLKNFRDAVSERMADIRKQCDIVVGVHIRQGDFKSLMDGRWFYPTSFYIDTIKEMQSRLGGRNVGFLICSNELQDRAQFNGLNTFIGTRHMIEDLYSLAACDYIIAPPSSFSRWASFYGKVPLLHLESMETKVTLDKFEILSTMLG